jgi:ubiquinol-cytochrome c reductase iron-sulfur subunit
MAANAIVREAAIISKGSGMRMEAAADPREDGATRRDFIYIATSAFAAIGAAAALWPVVDQWNPDANTLSMASLEVDLAPVQSGQAITILWRGKPIFIRNRTPEEIEKAKTTPLSDLKDTFARVSGAPEDLPATDENRTKPENENWLIMIGICTHLGCLPKGQSPGDPKGEYGGWFCVCHGSVYDTAGRIRQGPAPRNLDIPPYQFTGANKIRIG